MWAHYGDNNRGVVLLFSFEEVKAAFGDDLIWDGKVSYSNFLSGDSSLGSLGDIRKYDPRVTFYEHVKNHFVENAVPEISQKYRCWSGEHEYRFAIYNDSCSYHNVHFAHALKGLVLGFDCDDETAFKVYECAAPFEIPIWRVNWDILSARFDLQEITPESLDRNTSCMWLLKKRFLSWLTIIGVIQR